jgi:thymidylate synthase (FAD)
LKIDVLDKGYVRLVDILGDDRSVVNAARVSYDKESDEFSEKDSKLLKFLIAHGHLSPLRHAVVTLEVYAPLLTARQWWKYAVASTHLEDQSGWNESSRRYITEDEEFYLPRPGEWRGKPVNSKQGSGDWLEYDEGEAWTEALALTIDRGVALYESAMDAGIAPEQARLFLPAYGLYVRWRWTISLAGLLHFLDERLDSHAQYEIRRYAIATNSLVEGAFPETLNAWREVYGTQV